MPEYDGDAPLGQNERGVAGDDERPPKEDPKWFREWKSKMDVRLAQEAEARRAVEAKLAQIQAERDAERMSTMDEVEREKYLRQRLEGELQQMRQNQELAYKALLRQQELAKIVAETGIPLEEIENAPSADAAWVMGIRYMRRKGQGSAAPERVQEETRQERREQGPERNRVDLGQGQPKKSDLDDWKREYQRLRDSGNAVALIEFLRNRPRPKD